MTHLPFAPVKAGAQAPRFTYLYRRDKPPALRPRSMVTMPFSTMRSCPSS